VCVSEEETLRDSAMSSFFFLPHVFFEKMRQNERATGCVRVCTCGHVDVQICIHIPVYMYWLKK